MELAARISSITLSDSGMRSGGKESLWTPFQLDQATSSTSLPEMSTGGHILAVSKGLDGDFAH